MSFGRIFLLSNLETDKIISGNRQKIFTVYGKYSILSRLLFLGRVYGVSLEILGGKIAEF